MIHLIKPGFALMWSGFLYPIFAIFSCAYSSKASKRLYAEAATKKYDVIVVPGVPFEKDKWDHTMKGRIYWAKFLFDQGIAKNIMFSGSAVYTPFVEAKIMALYAEAIGIPKENVLTEEKAEHSTENIYYSYKKAKKLGFETVALASDPFQTKMLRKFTLKKVSPDIDLIPMVMDTVKKIEHLMKDPVIDAKQAYVSNFVSIAKRESFWKRLQGTMGHHINPSAY
ncbi:MAG: YdcF family protein [Bacteroidetes bacterium]|nr:MAG: YdcF family protein [Bacteroidota bacterium]